MSYEAGILNDFGGGNIQWWHDYIRTLLALSDEHWLDEIGRVENELEGLQAENDKSRERNAKLENLLNRGIDILEVWKALKGNPNDR